MIGEAVNPNEDYEATVRAIEDALETHTTATADLGDERYFLAGSLAVMRQYGAEDEDDGLTLCIGVVHEPGSANITYELTLTRFQGADEVEDGRTGAEFHLLPSPDDLEAYDPDEGEDWRARLAAAAFDPFEAWYQIHDGDVSPRIQAACWGDEDGQRALEDWHERPEKELLRTYYRQRRRERRQQRKDPEN
jgi:hypothetical protein